MLIEMYINVSSGKRLLRVGEDNWSTTRRFIHSFVDRRVAGYETDPRQSGHPYLFMCWWAANRLTRYHCSIIVGAGIRCGWWSKPWEALGALLETPFGCFCTGQGLWVQYQTLRIWYIALHAHAPVVRVIQGWIKKGSSQSRACYVDTT